MPPLRRRHALPPPTRRLVALSGGALALVAGAVGARRGRRGAGSRLADPAFPAPAEPAPSLPPPSTTEAAIERLVHPAADRAALGDTVSEAYRSARRAFGRVSEALDAEGLDQLGEKTTVLWCCATVAEPFATVEGKALARPARELAALIDEHRDLARLVGAARARAAGPGSGDLAAFDRFAEQRQAKLERRILARGKRLYASKPARVARRIADDAP